MSRTVTLPTFAELAELEPRLAWLERDIKAVKRQKRGSHWCANQTWYSRFKPRLLRLVGWYAVADAPAELRTMQAYDVAYRTLYDLLPGCRRCSCL